jgi:hypothetical protein
MKSTKKRRVNKFVLMLSKIYELAYYIVQKFYNKANGVIEETKMYLNIYKFKLNPTN